MTSLVPSPLASNQSTSPTSSLASRRLKSKRSRTGRGAASVGCAPPTPRLPVTGSRSQASPSFTARKREYRDSGTGSATTRSARPAGSTTMAAARLVAVAVTVAVLPVPSLCPASWCAALASPIGRPPGSGANGDGVDAASGTR